CIVVLVCRLGRLSPAVRHALWLLVLLKFLIPPFVDWPWALPLDVPGLRSEATAYADTPGSSEHLLGVNEEELSVLLRLVEPPETQEGTVPGPAAVTTEAAISDQNVPSVGWHPAWLTLSALAVWWVGSLVICALQLVRVVRM